MSALYDAYAEYLERMLDSTDELACVAEETIPDDANISLLEEWAYVG